MLKTILNVIGPDVLEVAGSSQLSTGQLGGCEAAVYAIRELFSSCEGEAALLVDASNAFNSIIRQNIFQNILNLFPASATIVINCYHINVPLLIDDDVIFSAEGTRQGDLLAMVLYTIRVPLSPVILIEKTVLRSGMLTTILLVGLSDICDWWTEISSLGPRYGYFSNTSRSW